MQWKKSFPKPLPRRQTLQNGQWYTSLSSLSSQKLHTEQKYRATTTPHALHSRALGCLFEHAMQTISVVAYRSIVWSSASSWQNRHTCAAPQHAATSRAPLA
jgi:hypothetical protein